jgi:quercetin dioxygenase-like cupin family protein
MRHTKLLTITLGGLFLGCAETRPAEDYPEAVTADPAHYSVEYENDAVRLLRIQYGPGEESVMHYHPATCSIALGAASWQMTDPEGTVTQDSAALGQVDCGDATVHLPANPGTQASELILVEFKDGATAGMATWEYPDAVAADPAHYSVEFENDVVRLLRIAYGPGERSVMHYHPANCSVSLGDASWRMTDPAGTMGEDTVTSGEVECGDAGVHLPENTSNGASELILIEFKGLEAFGE